MEKCKLCLKNDADDTGSHVVPHFLLKRIFNVDGAKGRDRELSFKLTAFNVESHYGRSVQPEKLEEIFGELTDEERVEKAIAELVVNNEWCKTCEKKFADMESFYSKTLEFSEDEPYQSTKDSLGATMFWLSIIWRCSVTGVTELTLTDKDRKKIRNLLNDYQPGTDNEAFIVKHADIFKEISYKVYRSADYCKKCGPEKGSFLFVSKLQQPYAIMVDEFVVMIYMKNIYRKMAQPIFLGFEKLDSATNDYKNGEIVWPIKTEEFAAHVDRLVQLYKDLRIKSYESALDRIYRKIGHKGSLPEHIKNDVLDEVTKEETKIGRKYTYADFAKCASTVLMKHYNELSRIKN
jgi:hypothetical protein